MRRLLIMMLTLTLGLGAGVTTSSAAHAATPKKRTISLIIEYTVAKDCRVYQNLPRAGVKGNGLAWRIKPGDTVGWRYNVKAKTPVSSYTRWAVISDKKYRNTGHPWWGFVDYRCVGVSIRIKDQDFPTPGKTYPGGKHAPSFYLKGRSQFNKDHYAHVQFVVSGGTVVNKHQLVHSAATLRDKPHGSFVIGNVGARWHVRTTNQHEGPWIKVYVPNSKQWGWIEDKHLHA